MRYWFILIPLILLALSGCAHTNAGVCTPGPGCEIPDHELGEFDAKPFNGLAFGYSCYQKLPQEDTAVCRSSYGLSPAEVAIGKENCEGIVLEHRCPTNSMLYVFGRHSRGDPARPMFTYLYFGDRRNSQVVSHAALLGPDTEFNPGFLGRISR